MLAQPTKWGVHYMLARASVFEDSAILIAMGDTLNILLVLMQNLAQRNHITVNGKILPQTIIHVNTITFLRPILIMTSNSSRSALAMTIQAMRLTVCNIRIKRRYIMLRFGTWVPIV